MDFWQTVLVLVRRWYVVVPAFAASLAGVLALYASTPIHYVSHSVLVLTTPLTGSSLPANPEHPNSIVNPLLNFEQGLSTSAAIIIQALGSPEVVAKLGASAEGDTRYQVTNGSTNPELLTSGPFIFIAGESATAEGARAIVERVVRQAEVQLADRQAELRAPQPTYITVDQVVPPTTAEAEKGSRARAAAAALALALVGSLASAFAAESLAQALRRRRARVNAPADPTRAPEPALGGTR